MGACASAQSSTPHPTNLRDLVQSSDAECIHEALKQGILPAPPTPENWTPLMTAAQQGHYLCTSLLIRKNISPINAATTTDGTTALMLSAENGHNGCLRLLIDHGSEVNKANEAGMTALRLAASCGHSFCVRTLIQNGALIDSQGRDGKTALMVSAGQGHSECVKMLINLGASVDVVSNQGKTALQIAREQYHLACIAILRRAAARETGGVTVGGQSTNRGNNPIFSTNDASNRNSASYQTATAAGGAAAAGVNQQSRPFIFTSPGHVSRPHQQPHHASTTSTRATGSPSSNSSHLHIPPPPTSTTTSPSQQQQQENQQSSALSADSINQLHIAARTGELPRLFVALNRCAPVDARTADGSTALILSSVHGHPACIRSLLHAGARINAVKDDGCSALIAASQFGQLECLEVLLERGASLEIRNHNHQTALIVAAIHGHASCLRVLIHSGADVDGVDKEGSSALILSASQGHIQCLKILLENGADPDKINTFHQNALIYAARGGHIECVRMLMSHGITFDAGNPYEFIVRQEAGYVEEYHTNHLEGITNRDNSGLLVDAGIELNNSDNTLNIDNTLNNSNDDGGNIGIVPSDRATASTILENQEGILEGNSTTASSIISEMMMPQIQDRDDDDLSPTSLNSIVSNTAAARPCIHTPSDSRPSVPTAANKATRENSLPSAANTIIFKSSTNTRSTAAAATSADTLSGSAVIDRHDYLIVLYKDLIIGPLLSCSTDGPAGRVYSARWKKNTDVAVKLFSLSNSTSTPSYSSAFNGGVVHPDLDIDIISEYDYLVTLLPKIWIHAGLLATLLHPRIINFLGICEDPLCIVTEKCDRGSLWNILQRAKSDSPQAKLLLWSRRLSMLADAAVGMAYLHDRPTPIVHKNLKSRNLLIDTAWRVKISDVGLNHIVDDVLTSLLQKESNKFGYTNSTGLDSSRGKAPEVLETGKYSQSSDVYSFGVIMWEMLTWEVAGLESRIENTTTVEVRIKDGLNFGL